MQLDLDWILGVVAAVALAPVVADGVRKYVAGTREGRGCDAATDLGIAFETVFGVLVPEVEGAIASGSAEGAVDRVERDCIDRVHFCDFALRRVRLAVALEGKVEASTELVQYIRKSAAGELTWCLYLRRTEWRIGLQSILLRNPSGR
jgi:hypothetical protein